MMNIPVTWRDPSHTILVQNFNGEWTLNDYYETIEATYDLIDMTGHPVDVMVDVSLNPGSASRLIAAAGELGDVPDMARVHPNQRLMVIVGGGQFIRTLIQMAAKYAPRMAQKLLAADTFDEARTLINRHRLGYSG